MNDGKIHFCVFLQVTNVPVLRFIILSLLLPNNYKTIIAELSQPQ